MKSQPTLDIRPTVRLKPGKGAKGQVYYPTSDNEPMGETDVHSRITRHLIDALEARYESDPDIYVSGDNFIYYVEGDPKKVVSPDIYVVKGVHDHLRDIFKVWEEDGHTPDIAIEITSAKSRLIDTRRKYDLYQDVLRVPEYVIFDPLEEYLSPRLRAWRLSDGVYRRIPEKNGNIFSEVLELDFVVDGKSLRLYDPKTMKRLPTGLELRHQVAEEARHAAEEAQRAQQEAVRAGQESLRADEAERRVIELAAEIERLKSVHGT